MNTVLTNRVTPYNHWETPDVWDDFSPYLFCDLNRSAQVAYVAARGMELDFCIIKIKLFSG